MGRWTGSIWGVDFEGGMMGQQQYQQFEQAASAQYGQQQYQRPPVIEYSHNGTATGLEREPGSVDEEDVHDFLRDEPEQGEKRI